MKGKYSWPWPSCHKQPRTLSFRASNANESNTFMTINSVYLDAAEPLHESSSNRHITEPNHLDSIEIMIRGLRRSSTRLFFDEKGDTSSILEGANNRDINNTADDHEISGFKENTMVMTMDSRNPFEDFRKSMEEMVEAYGLRDWEDLEELLSRYLEVNEKKTHGCILGAFVDLLVGGNHVSRRQSSVAATSCSCSYKQESLSCPLSFDNSFSCSDESSS